MTIFSKPYLRLPLVLGLLVFVTTFFIKLILTPVQAAEIISFNEEVLPLLQFRCPECHQPQGAGYENSGFDLRTYQSLLKGTKFGTVIIPGDPFMSNLMVLLDGRADPEIQMPHGKKKLSRCDRDVIRKWIKQGALNN